MKKFPVFLVVLLALSASLVLVACGSSDNSSDAPTKAEFITQADAICAKGDAAIQKAALDQFGANAPNKAQIADFLSTTEIPNIEQQAADLRELTPPSGDEDTIDALLNSLDDGISTIKDDPAGSISGANPLADANKQAKAYGLKSCGASS